MANNTGLGVFAGNFLNAFTQAKQGKERREDEKKELAARTKLFELQLKREQAAIAQSEQQQGAQSELVNRMMGSEPLLASPNTRVGDPRGPASLTDLLADPEGAMLLLRSGMLKGEDLLKREDTTRQRSMIEKLMGGGGGAQGMQLQGVKIGPSGEMMPDFGLPQVTSPQTVMGPDGPRLKTFDPRTGKAVADLGEPKPENVAPEVAGRISGLLQGREIASQVRSAYIKPDGSIDNTLVMSAFGNVPGTKGRQVRNNILIAVDSVLRARTGAGVNVKEQDDVVTQFMPSPLDSDEGKLEKLDRLQQFIDGTLDIATLPPSLRKRREKSQGGGGEVIDWSELPD